jgi:hypothetical protein
MQIRRNNTNGVLLISGHLVDKEKIKETSKINWKNVEKVGGELREQPIPAGAPLAEKDGYSSSSILCARISFIFQRACVSVTGVRRH